MVHSFRIGSLAAALLVLATVNAGAQTITRVSPEAAAIGDTVTLTGSNLAGTTAVRFFASVGGFVGVWTVNVVPTSVSATAVTAVVPEMAAFAPPGASPPGDPVGTVRVVGPALSNTLPFFYIQATPEIDTPGNGSPQPGGIGAPAIAFTIAGGAPASPNPTFVLTLEHAVPNSSAILAIGLPGTPPFPLINGGTFTINPLGPIVLVPALPVNAAGDILVPAGIPAGLAGISLTLQWIVMAPGAFLSNGLRIDF